MRKTTFQAVAAALAVGVFCSMALGQAAKPNIVLIMVDDMGYGELGVTGQLDRAAATPGIPVIETPHIDTLAQQGLMMSHFYATPICGSTRSAVMTGFHNGHSSVDRNGGNNGGNAMRAEDITVAETLKTVNYTTGQYGKWGQGGYNHTITGGGAGNINNAAITHPDATPASQGFDEYYGYLNQVHAHSYYVNFLWEHDTDNSGDVGGMQKDPTSTSDYTHDLIADKSLQFISDHAGGSDPFFMYAPYTIPHGNFDPPQDAIWQAYIDAGYSTAQANYAAMMKRLDNTVGDIVDRLKDPDQNGNESDSVYDDTLIVFFSDNGGTGPQMDLFDARAGLSGSKGSVKEGGIKTPFIAHWNGTIAPGQVNDTRIGTLEDMFATFADLGGAEAPVGLDGVSLAGLFTGGEAEKRDVFIWEGNGSSWAIRMGDWKLIGNSLYHLPSDPDESDNVAAANPEIKDLMQQIALDEGVLSDAGTGAAQTTHIVQYKTWAGGSTDWHDNANWAGGTQFNTRGTAANNYATGPANNWIATVDNTAGGAQALVVSTDNEVLALEVSGSVGTTKIKVENGVALTARNGARVHGGATIELDGGSLNTLRVIDIRQGGKLVGRGDITPIYDTTGTPFVLKADVVNAGELEIGFEEVVPDPPAATVPVELVANGGFEFGTGNAFSATDDWFGFDGDDAINGRNTSNPASGAYRAIVGFNAGNGNTPSPAQDTGHVIALGDEYTFSFAYAGAGSWTLGVEQLEATLYYLDGATPVDLFSTVLTPTLNFGSGYNAFNNTLAAVTDANAVGKNLLVRFEKFDGDGGFGSVDDVSITIDGEVVDPPDPPDPPALTNVLNIDGDLTQLATASMAFDLFGSGGEAGIDFDQLNVTGDVALDGALSVTQNVTPVLGDSFVVLTSGSLSGTFDHDAISGVALDASSSLAVLYEGNDVRLFATYHGDANGDGTVSLADLNALGANFGATGATWQTGDFNYDGEVSLLDLNALGANFGQSVPASPAVPEPAGVALLGLGALVFTRRR